MLMTLALSPGCFLSGLVQQSLRIQKSPFNHARCRVIITVFLWMSNPYYWHDQYSLEIEKRPISLGLGS